MDFSTEKLLALARNYWRADKVYDEERERSPEALRLDALLQETLQRDDYSRWHALSQELQQELPGFLISSGVSAHEHCFQCVAYSGLNPGRFPPFRLAVVGCISILAPVYIVYGLEYDLTRSEVHYPKVSFEPLPPEMRAPADLIARKLEATFDVRRLPREVAETPIPLVVRWKEPPETTLFHALFTSLPENAK
jgi:hypothetical protein